MPAQATWALRAHWPEYLIEAACVGLFMVSACSFTVLLQHPGSTVPGDFECVWAATDYWHCHGFDGNSPGGKQSGAHLNPSVTLSFFRLGKLQPWDAVFYVLAQFVGGVLGVLLSARFWGEAIAHEKVRYAVTQPEAARGRHSLQSS